MNVRDLLDVQAICQAGSLRKAAVALGITQPTLSTRIAHLEDQLGTRLFDRSRGQSRPTALAEFIAARAAGISSGASLLIGEINRLASGQTGRVRLGLGSAPLRALVAPLVAGTRAERPDISLEIVSGTSVAMRSWLMLHEVDIVVGALLEPADPVIQAELMIETELVIVAHPDHPMFKQPPAGIREVFRYPAALPFMEPRYADFLRANFDVELDNLAGHFLCSDFDVLARVTADAPHFFTAGPRFAFSREIDAGRLRVLEAKVPQKHRVLMHTNRTAYPLPAVSVVQDVLRRVCAEFAATIP